VVVLNPSFALNRFNGALLNGVQPAPMKSTIIGVGALGSQTLPKLIRGGFGSWIVIDKDHLLPHNLARHELTEPLVGFPKALGMQMLANHIVDDQAVKESITADVLAPADQKERVDAAIKDVELVLDFSASIPVARYLAALAGGPRRVSAFLNPSGTDLVILGEDAERQIGLDCLEMQYYRLLLTEPELSDHFSYNDDGRVRYAQTCRDLTSQIPEDLVGLHSAIAARAVRNIASDPEAGIHIWHGASDLGVRRFSTRPSLVQELAFGDWRVRTDDYLLTRLATLREDRLPNETGGVFIGSIVVERRIMYLVDTIPSPPDSQEWPVLYIRGCQGLPERLKEIDHRTAGMLQYVGEWHSHPDGYSVHPSSDDKKVFQWLIEHLQSDGLPPVMAIVGESRAMNWFFGSPM
jgi:hypothetical protein